MSVPTLHLSCRSVRYTLDLRWIALTNESMQAAQQWAQCFLRLPRISLKVQITNA